MAVAIDNTSATAKRLFIGLLDDERLGEGGEERGDRAASAAYDH
jgi:hypothetical protein